MKKLIVIFCGILAGQWCPATFSGNANLSGYQEAVIVSLEGERWQNLLTHDFKWARLSTGRVNAETLKLWGSCDKANYALYGNPGTRRGYIRIVTFFDDCPDPAYQRPNDQSWDTGGHYDVNVRVRDIAKLRLRLLRQGWHATSDPVTFTFGPFNVTEWIAHGPDGAAFAFIERHSPPLEGWPHLKITSRLFNSTQIVRDMDAARAFYEQGLGFKEYLYHEGPSDGPVPNVLGMPFEIAAMVTRKVVILHPEGTNEGSVELLEFAGLTGRDFSAGSEPARAGISTLRFPVKNLRALREHLSGTNWPMTGEVRRTVIAPYGRVLLSGMAAPDGAWLEFFQVVEP